MPSNSMISNWGNWPARSVTSKLHAGNHDLEEQINDAWAEIFRRLMTSGLTAAEYEDRLLRAHWFMAYDPVQKNWDGSKSIKQRFHLRIDPAEHKTLLGEVRAYVRSLRDSVLVFTEVFAPTQSGAFSAYPQERQAELREWAMKLPRTGVLSTFLPALMAVRLR